MTNLVECPLSSRSPLIPKLSNHSRHVILRPRNESPNVVVSTSNAIASGSQAFNSHLPPHARLSVRLRKMQSTVAALSPGSIRTPAAGNDVGVYTRVEAVYGERSSLIGIRRSSSTSSCCREVYSGLVWNRSRRFGSGFLVRENRREVKRLAAAEADGETEAAAAAAAAKKQARILQLAVMFGIWYLLNIYFNIFNKQVLKVFPFPATFTAFQFGCGTVIVLVMWTLNLHPKPKFSRSQLAGILALAVVHTIGNVLTNISLGKVSVSFTHTIKALEPFFTVALSALFLGSRPSIWVTSSLLPIVGGVALASLTEASFNWVGFCSAMASNVTNQSRNVFSKKLMGNKEESMDNINLFSVITIISFVLLVPAAIFIEGIRFTPSNIHSAVGRGMSFKDLCTKALLAGICFHSYQQVSYMILQMVSPVTHAVGNCVKRVVVIISSVVFFQTPVSPLNSLGTGIALAGVFLYSRAKSIKDKQKSV